MRLPCQQNRPSNIIYIFLVPCIQHLYQKESPWFTKHRRCSKQVNWARSPTLLSQYNPNISHIYNPYSSFHLLFHYPNITPTYPIYIYIYNPYSSFHFLFHYPNVSPIYTLHNPYITLIVASIFFSIIPYITLIVASIFFPFIPM